jgi:hypothetical protein
MALDDLVGNTQNYTPGLHGGLGGYLGNGQHPGFGILQPSPPSVSPIFGGGGLGSVEDQITDLRQLPFPRHFQPSFPRAHLPDPSMPRYMLGNLKTRMEGFGEQLGGFGETLGGYSSQFDKFGEQLGGLGEQMTGYQDALGSFNEQMGGMGKQFETINNRLDSVDKGLGSLGNQIASFENMQKAQPQQVMQPQRPAFNQFNPFGFGGLGSLFMRR